MKVYVVMWEDIDGDTKVIYAGTIGDEANEMYMARRRLTKSEYENGCVSLETWENGEVVERKFVLT